MRECTGMSFLNNILSVNYKTFFTGKLKNNRFL